MHVCHFMLDLNSEKKPDIYDTAIESCDSINI